MRTLTTLLALGLALITGVLAVALGLSIVAAGFSGYMAWPEVARQAALPLALGMVTLGLFVSHALEIRRRGTWPRTSSHAFIISALAAAVGLALFNDAGFYACTPHGCFNILTAVAPFLHGLPYVRAVEQAVGVILLVIPGFTLGRTGPVRPGTAAA
jgi:uncharacterized membrane protein